MGKREKLQGRRKGNAKKRSDVEPKNRRDAKGGWQRDRRVETLKLFEVGTQLWKKVHAPQERKQEKGSK